jgi:hypothetical protein
VRFISSSPSLLLSSSPPLLLSSSNPRTINTPNQIMAESGGDHHNSGGDNVDCCDVCDFSDESAEDLYFCQACKCTFCSSCWKAQAAHNSKRKNALPPGATVHEKTKLSIIRLVQPAFSSPADDVTLETRLAEDADAAWFGESCNA